MSRVRFEFATMAVVAVLAACGGDDGNTTPDGTPAIDGSVDGPSQVVEGACQIADETMPPDSLGTITCEPDFQALASQPIDATLPGARSTKVILDTADSDHLYFQDSKKFQIHYAFASTHLSGNGLPVVADLSTFNAVEYFSPDRRFILGAVTYYEGPGKWTLELSPYDTASAAQIQQLYESVALHSYFGPDLYFHPTSAALATVAAGLPTSVKIITTDELYAGIDFQPLALGVAVGELHITTVAALAGGEYLSPYDIAVLDDAPNDISVVQGLITQNFQTPLSHVNVLAHNRGTPNMGLRGALTNAQLVALKDKLIKLTVTAESYTVEEVTQEYATQWWADHAPTPVTLPAANLGETTIRDIADVTPDPTGSQTLGGNLRTAVTTYGGKAAHYSTLVKTPGVPIKPAFAIPIYYYDQFMTQNGFFTRLDALLADPTFTSSAAARDAALTTLRNDMIAAPLDPAFVTAVRAKLAGSAFATADKVRFRSSSNSEDLAAFPCAGCYDSYSASVADSADLQKAIKRVYASVWTFRAFELRSYYQVSHRSVGMALLVHESFPDEEANGVAITNNPFDASGLDPAYYVNVQINDEYDVVAPPPGITSDQFLYYFNQPNQPISYIAHSNQILSGHTVLSTAQIYSLGQAMQKIHDRFSPAYGPAAGNTGWYAMDIEFKFDDDADPTMPPTLYIKQARSYADPSGSTP